MTINPTSGYTTTTVTNAPAQRTNGAAFAQLLENSSSELDTVTLQGASSLLSMPMLTPTTKNAGMLSAALKTDLAEALNSAGFPADPPVEVEVDGETGHIRVTTDRPDAAAIEEFLNSDPELAQEIRTVKAINSHVSAMEQSLAFQREYMNSSDPESVVAKYSWLFQ